MDIDEIKRSISMAEVLSRYGIETNRAGFICCPFHQEKTASCKIYPDSYYCFGCHAHGDVISFVQKMEQCDFKKAFQILGGTNEPLTDGAILRIQIRKAQETSKRLKKERLTKEYINLCDEIKYVDKAILYAPRDSKIYADALKRYDWMIYKLNYLFNELDTKRK